MSDHNNDFETPSDATVDLLVKAIDRAYHRPWLLMWRSFLHGMMSAIGAAFGTFLIFGVCAYIFSYLGGTALFKPLIEDISKMITNSYSTQLKSSVEASLTASPSPTTDNLDVLLKQLRENQ